MAEEIDYRKYGWVPPTENKSVEKEPIDYTKYGYVPPESEEGMTKSAMMAIPRVGKDIGESVLQGIRNIPSDIEYAKTAIPSYAQSLVKHPIKTQLQGAAGLTELGHGLLNTLHNAAEYTSDRLHLLPKSIADKVPKQKDIAGDINQLFGAPQNQGEEVARGLSRNIFNILGGAGTAGALNPLKLTSGNIAKNIVLAESKMKNKYSGKNGLYEKLSDAAASRGMKEVKIPNIDMDTIEKYTAPKNTETLYQFAAKPNLVNAQKAISDLGYLERRLENKATLIEPEKEQLKAIKDAKQKIQKNMFKDNEGKIHQDLLNQHKEIQKGYATEVIPYTKNRAIQAYKKDEKLPNELVSSLSKGKFAAQRGKFHPEIKNQKLFKSLLKHFGVPATAGISAVGGGLLGYHLLNGEKND